MGEHFSSTCVIVAGLFFGGIGFAAAAEAPPPASIDSCITYDATSGEPLIDAGCFFQMLVTRYRDLAFYEDVSHVLRVTRRSGEEPQSVETEIGCEIADGKLRVQTPRSQALDLFGLQGLVPPIEPSERAGVQYDLWLAPHLVPRFAQDGHASDADEASQYTAMTAEAVTLDEKPMILLAVERAVDADPETSATLDLYVDPESMLVERAEHRQTLPDGASYETTVEITRQTARTKAEVVEAEQGGADSEESDRESRDDLPAAVPDEPPVTQSIDPRHSDR
jgi:hypothetical protein